MSTLTTGDLVLMIFVTILGIAFFLAVCATIYFIFKKLERVDSDQLERDGKSRDVGES